MDGHMGTLYNKRKFDYDAIFEAASACVSDKKMAEQCNIPIRTWVRAKANDKKFKAAYDEGREIYMQDYRDEMWELFRQACRTNGQSAYLIFAMKNVFGWNDNANSNKSADTQVNLLVGQIDSSTKALINQYKKESKTKPAPTSEPDNT